MNEESPYRLFPRAVARLNYLARFGVMFVALLLLMVALDLVTWNSPEPVHPAIFLSLVGCIVVLRIIAMDIPRARSAGLSPWLLLLFAVPGVNAIIQILLFALPPKQRAEQGARPNASEPPPLSVTPPQA